MNVPWKVWLRAENMQAFTQFKRITRQKKEKDLKIVAHTIFGYELDFVSYIELVFLYLTQNIT